MNSALYGKTYRIPEHIRQKIQGLLYGLGSNDNMGIRRAKFIVNNGTCSYQMMKRLKNFFDYADPTNQQTEYELAGGKDMKMFVERTLNSERRNVSDKKKSNIMFMPQVSNRTLTPNSGSVDLSVTETVYTKLSLKEDGSVDGVVLNDTDEFNIEGFEKIGGVAIIFSRGNGGDKVLLVKRHELCNWEPNKYALVGGKIEDNETPENGTKREVLEETGLVIDDFIDEFIIGYEGKTFVHAFIAVVQGEPNVQLNDENTAYGWFSTEQIVNLPTVPHLDDVIAVAKQKLIIWTIDNEETNL